ncbi:MAG TPA: (d)CMP kinase [Longimicrobiales bacterium]|nr:(d)CMP kinase [Longimicrobiales bacterium]
MIVTIDGPAGSGKSSTAREVARRLGFRHLDSGAFYRALTHAALSAGIPPERWPELSHADLDGFRIHASLAEGGYRLLAGDDDVSAQIRSPAVNAHVSQMARLPAVRGWLLERLRDAARGTDLVADGRDLGTVVFPDADLKVFLVADPIERARRRLAEHGVTTPGTEELAAEVERLTLRDRIDSERELAPLAKAPDAVVLDTTSLDFDAQVECVVALVRSRQRERARD